MTRRFGPRASSFQLDQLDDAWRMASVVVGSKSPTDRIGLRGALGLDLSTNAPRDAVSRQREAETIEAACRARLSRLDGALLERLQRILANGATRIGRIVDDAVAERARRGLGGAGSDSAAPTVRSPAVDGWDVGPIDQTTGLQEARERTPVDERAVIQALGPGGVLGEALDGFSVRPGQVKMARAVTRAVNTGLRILVEAGTGTGKSLAYLIPAAMHAIQNGRRVVISTHTIALQDQLVNKDVPVLRRALSLSNDGPSGPWDLRVAVLKGRANYLCLRRWRRFLVTNLVGETERVFAARIAIWLTLTVTGDRNELALDDTETAIWNTHLAADVLHCTGRLCPENRSGRCWISRARRRAAAAHLVIVNHALLLTDLATASTGERGVLPDYAEAIIDEAHHLEAVATDHLGTEIATKDLVTALGALSTPMGGARFGGTISRIAATYVEVGGQFARDTVGDFTAEIHATVAAARDLVGPFRDALGSVASGDSRLRPGGSVGDDVGAREVRLVPEVRNDPTWMVVCEAWENLAVALKGVSDSIGRFKEAFDPHLGVSETVDDAVIELTEAIALLDETRSVTAKIVLEASEDEVAWVSLDRAPAGAQSVPREVRLHAAPLRVDRELRALLFEGLEAVVLTSATLRVDGTFQNARTRLGLESNVHVLAVESPFDYENQALLVVPRDLPDPSSPASASVVNEILAGIGEAMGGRTLVLFTSHAGLRGAHAALCDALPNLVVLGQGIDGPRNVLLERFRETPNAILLGTSSFWEGIDVTGEALSCLVIVKIPFTVPSDPVFAARSELLADPFDELAIPQAVVRMRQGFGRLIRTTTDRGVVVVLDSRLINRRYGQVFFDSLPPATRRVCGAREIVPIVEAWWGR